MHLDVGAVIWVENDIPDKLRDPHGLSSDKCLAMRAHSYKFRLSEPHILRIHERWFKISTISEYP